MKNFVTLFDDTQLIDAARDMITIVESFREKFAHALDHKGTKDGFMLSTLTYGEQSLHSAWISFQMLREIMVEEARIDEEVTEEAKITEVEDTESDQRN